MNNMIRAQWSGCPDQRVIQRKFGAVRIIVPVSYGYWNRAKALGLKRVVRSEVLIKRKKKPFTPEISKDGNQR